MKHVNTLLQQKAKFLDIEGTGSWTVYCLFVREFFTTGFIQSFKKKNLKKIRKLKVGGRKRPVQRWACSATTDCMGSFGNCQSSEIAFC
jgi:hypothetical protein